MKNFVKSIVAVSALMIVPAVSAGTLYWQVADDGSDDFITAQMYRVQVNESGTIIDGSKTAISDEVQTPTGIQQTDITGYEADTYRFFVEMLNYNQGTITDGYKWNYQELVSSGYVSTGGIDIPTAQANAMAHGNFAQAPEPTSGLLLLMGGAMLALRRRRQK